MSQHLKELLSDSISQMRSLIRMMEPYYSQCNAEREAEELIERIEMVLPYEQVIKGRSSFRCTECTRTFGTPSAVSQHMEKHWWTVGARRSLDKRLSKEAKDRVVKWPTKADYLRSTEIECNQASEEFNGSTK
jgi:uncharacterized C2H2 Zn-finger protein